MPLGEGFLLRNIVQAKYSRDRRNGMRRALGDWSSPVSSVRRLGMVWRVPRLALPSLSLQRKTCVAWKSWLVGHLVCPTAFFL